MKVVGLISVAGRDRHLRLFELFGRVWPIRFEPREPSQFGSLDAAILLGGTPADADQAMRAGVTDCRSLPDTCGTGRQAAGGLLRFADSHLLPGVFRGRTLTLARALKLAPFEFEGGCNQEVVASVEGRPVWTVRCKGDSRADFAGTGLPQVQTGEGLRDHFHADNFFGLLPLVTFLRRICGEDAWKPPFIRACFMFDDPNLHATRYGWLDYQCLARHAAQHNYHVSFATIPLDAWYVNRKSAALLQDQQSRLSLLIHGNNHTRNELAQQWSEGERLRQLAQSLKRIERLERRTGLKVSRVMAAPHGACSAEAFRDMARLGYEAACVSDGSLVAWNPVAPWVQTLGLRMGEVIEGLPVMPRFRLRRGCDAAILLSAYLGQPIIPVGHHQDVRSGLQLLAALADFINSLGPVSWSNIETIARSSYQCLRRGDVLHVRIHSRRVSVEVPAGIRALVVERAWSDDGAEDLCVGPDGQRPQRVPPGSEFSVERAGRLWISSPHAEPVAPASVPRPAWRLWPVLRRQISEGRDRLLYRVQGRQAGARGCQSRAGTGSSVPIGPP